MPGPVTAATTVMIQSVVAFPSRYSMRDTSPTTGGMSRSTMVAGVQLRSCQPSTSAASPTRNLPPIPTAHCTPARLPSWVAGFAHQQVSPSKPWLVRWTRVFLFRTNGFGQQPCSAPKAPQWLMVYR